MLPPNSQFPNSIPAVSFSISQTKIQWRRCPIPVRTGTMRIRDLSNNHGLERQKIPRRRNLNLNLVYADPKALDDQSPLVEVEDEPADTDPVAPNDQEPVPTEQSPPGEAEDDPADFVEEPLRCSICMEEGHSYMSCPLTWFCPPETAVSDLAEIVCYCCCERIDSGVHSNIPARMTKAQLIPRWPRCMPDVDTKALELELHTKQPQLGEAEDVKEEKPKPDTDPMALDDDQALQPTKQSPLVEAEDEPTDFVEEPLRCSICMEEGHSYMSCPLTWFCPPETAVSDLAEIVCYCCCERIDSGVHSNIPARMTRAQLIPRWPRCMPDVDTKALELELRSKQPQYYSVTEEALKAPIKDRPTYFVLGSSRKVVIEFMSQKSTLFFFFARYFSFALINSLIYIFKLSKFVCCFVLIRS
ncbi:unnamed protein product [Malus baccata var. baccata]